MVGKRKNNNPRFTVARLADTAGVGLGTIRYYQKRGILAVPPTSPNGGGRTYSSGDVAQLSRVKRLQGLGFTLAEIAVLLANHKDSDCQPIRELIEKRLRKVQAQMGELKNVQVELVHLCKLCQGHCDGQCPLMNELYVVKPESA